MHGTLTFSLIGPGTLTFSLPGHYLLSCYLDHHTYHYILAPRAWHTHTQHLLEVLRPYDERGSVEQHEKEEEHGEGDVGVEAAPTTQLLEQAGLRILLLLSRSIRLLLTGAADVRQHSLREKQ